jgi:hypothetical protein
MKNECLHLLGDGAFLIEDKELTYEEHKSGKNFNLKTKSSCERKFKVGDIVTGVNPEQLSIYNKALEIIDYDISDGKYELENFIWYKHEDLKLHNLDDITLERYDEQKTKSSCEDVKSYNIGTSNYSQMKIQPWDIFEAHPHLNYWECDIIKRILRSKSGDSRLMDYKKCRHIIDFLIDMEEKNGNN